MGPFFSNVMDWDLPTLAWCAPLLGILWIFCIQTRGQVVLHRVTACWMLLPLLVVGTMALFFNGSGFQFERRIFWDSLQLGSHPLPFTYQVGVDGISLPLLLLSVILFPIAAIVSRSVRGASRGYYSLLLLLQACTLGALVAKDAMLFFLFLEGTLVGMFFLIGRFGYLSRERAAFTYLIMGGIGSLFLLVALFILLLSFESLDMEILAKGIQGFMVKIQDAAGQGATEALGLLDMLFWLLVIGFAIKLPIVPFHTWMVRTHTEAPLPVVMIHAGVLLKLGAYGFYRFVYALFPSTLERYAHWFILAGMVNLLYGALIAWSGREAKMLYGTCSWSSQGARKVLAYASLSHMGIVLIGLGSLNSVGVEGSLYQLIGHGLTAALAFLLILYLEKRLETSQWQEWSGLAAALPRFAVGMRFLALSLLGLPGMASFVGEVFVFVGVIQTYPVIAPWILGGFVLAAAYALRLAVQPTFGQPLKGRSYGWDLVGSEKALLGILGGLILFLGLWPGWLLRWFHPVVDTLLAPLGH